MPSATSDTGFLDHLKSIVGPKGWIAPTDAGKYFADPRDRFRGSAALIVLPSTTGEVSQIVASCNETGIGIIPFGGGTGGVAGHMEIDGGLPIVLSTERMNAIRTVNRVDEIVVAEAGCILADVQEIAQRNNRRFGLSLASEGSCSIGGNLASNAGGVQVLKYGNSRDLCLGIEAVLPDGSVLDDLKPLRKDNTGYDLRHLLIGSEGTLGIITAAALKLSPQPDEVVTFICAVPSPAAAIALLHSIRDRLGDTVTAFELMSGFGIELATRHFKTLRDPFDRRHDWYALVDVEGYRGIRGRLEEMLTHEFEQETFSDAVIAASENQRSSLWELRERAYEYNQKEGALCSSDTSVPISQIEAFIRQTDEAVRSLDPDLRCNRYGHIGDGNIHFNIFPPRGVSKHTYVQSHPDIRETARMLINETTRNCGGSISAEHGIGRLKVADLESYADPTKLAMMRLIKNAVDPNQIMNPGALFRR